MEGRSAGHQAAWGRLSARPGRAIGAPPAQFDGTWGATFRNNDGRVAHDGEELAPGGRMKRKRKEKAHNNNVCRAHPAPRAAEVQHSCALWDADENGAW